MSFEVTGAVAARPNQLFIHTKFSATLHDNILIGYEQQ